MAAIEIGEFDMKSHKNERGTGIGVLSQIGGRAEFQPFVNLIEIAKGLSAIPAVIEISKDSRSLCSEKDTGLIVRNVVHESSPSPVRRALNYFKTQLISAYHIVSLSNKVNLWVFYMGDAMVLPTIAGRLTGKKVLLLLCGYTEMEIDFRNSPIEKIGKILKRLNLTLSNFIVVYSSGLERRWRLEKWRRKVVIGHEHFLDFDEFRIRKEYNQRDSLIGYVGRLSREKGILNFIHAIPSLSSHFHDLRFLIAGEGPLREDVERYLKEEDLEDRVRMVGWIEHEDLPRYLNDLRLVVIPSYTEGLPNVMLEAMACGTPVLATDVGAIPDVIKEGETGFILPDNSPESISERIMDVISSPCLSTVSEKALEQVHERFSYEKAVQGWRDMLEDVSRKY